jgi:sulfane dehydrogenase subunit SoxC
LAALPKSWGRELGDPEPIPETRASGTPLQDSYGIITPSALNFERHHSGVPQIDPAKHELLVHGAVEHPLILKLEDLQRFPSVSRIHFYRVCRQHGGRSGKHPKAKCAAEPWTGELQRVDRRNPRSIVARSWA